MNKLSLFITIIFALLAVVSSINITEKKCICTYHTGLEQEINAYSETDCAERCELMAVNQNPLCDIPTCSCDCGGKITQGCSAANTGSNWMVEEMNPFHRENVDKAVEYCGWGYCQCNLKVKSAKFI